MNRLGAIIIVVVVAIIAFSLLARACGYEGTPDVTNGECRSFNIEAVMARLDVDQGEAIEILDYWRCR